MIELQSIPVGQLVGYDSHVTSSLRVRVGHGIVQERKLVCHLSITPYACASTECYSAMVLFEGSFLHNLYSTFSNFIRPTVVSIILKTP